MTFFRAFLCFFFILPVLVSCNSGDEQDIADSIDELAHSTENRMRSADSMLQPEITFKTFALNGGWGYDLYVDDKRTIHQPIVPAVAGNDAFATEEDAKKIGELAVFKMRSTGSFPTITIQELDSLGIKHQ